MYREQEKPVILRTQPPSADGLLGKTPAGKPVILMELQATEGPRATRERFVAGNIGLRWIVVGLRPARQSQPPTSGVIASGNFFWQMLEAGALQVVQLPLPEFRFLLTRLRFARQKFRRLCREFRFPLEGGFHGARRVVQRVRLLGTMFREQRPVFREQRHVFRQQLNVFREQLTVFRERLTVFRERLTVFRER